MKNHWHIFDQTSQVSTLQHVFEQYRNEVKNYLQNVHDL